MTFTNFSKPKIHTKAKFLWLKILYKSGYTYMQIGLLTNLVYLQLRVFLVLAG